MLGAALQSVHIKDRPPERLAAKTAAPRRRLADWRRSAPRRASRNADVTLVAFRCDIDRLFEQPLSRLLPGGLMSHDL